MSIDRWMDKKLWYRYTVKYYSAMKGNTFESVLMTWMNLEPIIQSEVSQKEKDKYRILTNIWNLEEWYWRTYLQSSSGETAIENGLMDMERGEERVKCTEQVTETYITICSVDSQWEFAIWLKKLKQCLCTNLEGWHGERDGKETQKGGDTCVQIADSCWCLTGNNRSL